MSKPNANKTDTEINLHSSVNQVSALVTQIIHFRNGNKRTFENIISSSIKQGEFTKFKLLDGRMLLINTQNVDCIEVFPQPDTNILDQL
jgi:hypothetical protein